MRDVPEKYKAGQAYHDSLYISIGEVEDRFKVSKQQQRNLYLKEEAPDAIYIGATLFYWRATAEPWFAEYDLRQKGRIKNAEERKEKKARGRPKKVKVQDAWRNTVFNGWEINIPEEFESPKKWVEHIHRIEMKKYQFYPAYQSAEHMAWLETWRALKQHFGIPEADLCI